MIISVQLRMLKRLEELQSHCNISDDELTKLANLRADDLSRLKQHAQSTEVTGCIDIDFVTRIAEVFGVGIDYFLSSNNGVSNGYAETNNLKENVLCLDEKDAHCLGMLFLSILSSPNKEASYGCQFCKYKYSCFKTGAGASNLMWETIRNKISDATDIKLGCFVHQIDRFIEPNR